MKTIKTLKFSSLFLFILIATQSCMVSSLHPLYTDNDRVHKEELNGIWIGDDDKRIEITTVTDTTGLAVQSKNVQNISKIKDKAGVKFKVKYSYNKKDNDSVAKDSLSKEERFMMGLDKKKNEEQSTGSTKENSNLSKEDRFMMGLDQDKKSIKADKSVSIKQIKYFMYPDTRKHYQIKTITKTDTIIYKGHISKINEHYFLDIIPDGDMLITRINNTDLLSLVTPMHGILKLKINKDQLQLNAIEYDSFERIIKKKKIRIEYIERNGKVIITSKTSDLQKFLIKFADTELFNNKDGELILSRLK